MSVSDFQASGTLMALSELRLQYKAPLRSGDVFYITTAIAQVFVVAASVWAQLVGDDTSSHGASAACLGERLQPTRAPPATARAPHTRACS
jgi:acyl-CoA thioesterase FadM